MSLLPLGSTGPIAAAADTTGQNAGNLTTVIDPSVITARVGHFNVWHMVLENLTLGAQARIVLNAYTFGGFGPATGSNREWWGNILMRPGDVLYFFWTLASSAAKPKLTVYLAYDPLLPGNQQGPA